ncbi:MAG: electron transport complex subunit RsxB [Pseudohongiellaceae bacterium]|nr:electron transport complex subunit RsxB [Pseudohongiellaceae bacterium]
MAQLLSLFIVVAVLSLLSLGILRLAKLLKVDGKAQEQWIERINGVLPQTQCGQCGYSGCRPYAQALSQGEAINKCPPGGAATINRLSNLLARESVPLDPIHGVESERKIAYIREADCIGCTKCIQACPVDAILGASKRMHTVIVSECTGCDLCVEPCPVDCIDMIPAQSPASISQWRKPGSPTTIIWPQTAPSIGDATKGQPR